MQFDGFDWDEGNWPKCGKHGVSMEAIEALFENPDAIVFPDVDHSGNEERLTVIGHSELHARLVIAVFTIRLHDGLRRVRPVTARFMHRKEINRHGFT